MSGMREQYNNTANANGAAAGLRSFPLLGKLSDEELSLLMSILQEVTFAEGEEILKEGEEGDRMYLLTEGSVDVLTDWWIFSNIALARKSKSRGDLIFLPTAASKAWRSSA